MPIGVASLPRAKADEIKALAAKGLSMGAIAIKLGIGKGSVRRAIGKSGSWIFKAAN